MKKIAPIVILLCFLLLYAGCEKHKTAQHRAKKTHVEKKFVNLAGLAIDSAFLKKYDDEMLSAFYRQNSFKTVWDKAENRQQLLEEIEKAEDEGLDPKEYHIKKLKKFESAIGSITPGKMVLYDIAITQSAQK